MSLRQRYIPPDIQEDIKIGKILPVSVLKWLFLVVILSIIVSFFIPNPIAKLIFVLGASILAFAVLVLDAPSYIKKLKAFSKDKKKLNTIDPFLGIESFGTICKKDDKEIVFLEHEVEPWEVSPSDYKEQRAVKFAENVMAAINMGVEVSIYATSSSEDTTQLENRLSKLDSLPEGIRELESNRIEHHYKLSRFASATKYKIRLERDTALKGEDEIEDITDAFVFDAVPIDGDSVRSYILDQLTPDSKLKRGKGVKTYDKPKASVSKNKAE